MSEQESKNPQAEQNAAPEEKTEQAVSSDVKAENSAKGAKSGKKSAASQKEASRLKKEWEDSIVTSKKVKREEMRRKLKRAMLIMLVFSLIVTSLVYVMLLFIQENNIRITATNRSAQKSISLSMDNDFWTPYLNAEGPDDMWNVSYDPRYLKEKVDTMGEVAQKLESTDFTLGSQNGEQYIRFTFMLKNTSNDSAHINYEMTLEFDEQHNLHDAVRVMWGQSFKNENEELNKNTHVEIFAALSGNERLAGSRINRDRTAEQGYLEYVAYPGGFTADVHPGQKYYYVKDYEELNKDAIGVDANNGFIAATPFDSDEFVFQREVDMDKGDIMYCYVCIWLEGSDFDCVDERLGGYCKLGLNFYAS